MSQAGWVLEDLPEQRPRFRLLTLLWGIAAYCQLAFFRPLCIESLRGAGTYYYAIAKTLSLYPKIRTLLIEGTGDTALLMVRAARRRNVRVIVVPQNLEALAPYEQIFTHRISIAARFRQELHLLQGIEAAFCISTEEEWLLRVFGLPAFYLPYRPAGTIAARLLTARENRSPLTNFGFLLLGSITNQPTLRGFRAFYRLLTLELGDLPVKIHVAGHGTERLREEFVDPRVVLHGTVTNAQLDDLMSKAEGLLIMQVPTSGYLTRVIEARYIGLPIIGNADAIKGLRELDGIQVYYQADDLRRLLIGPRAAPAIPPEPTAEMAHFKRLVEDRKI